MLLQHYGPAKTTVADIAKAANVGVGSVYLEFASKDAIIAALAQHRYETILQAMHQAAHDHELSFSERLYAVFETRTLAFLRFSEPGTHAMDLLHCHHCSGVRDALCQFNQAEHILLRELLEAAAQANEFTVSSPTSAAHALLQAFAVFSPPWLFEQSKTHLKKRLRMLHQLLLFGLKCRHE